MQTGATGPQREFPSLLDVATLHLQSGHSQLSQILVNAPASIPPSEPVLVCTYRLDG